MPVTGLYFCPDSGTTAASSSTIIDRISKRYQPVQTYKFSLEHRLLRETLPSPSHPNANLQAPVQQSSANNTRYMQYLELSHHPAIKFCLIDGKSLVTIDPEFDHILTSKLQGLWSMRLTLKAEGINLELEDFRIRVATLSQGSMIKGVLVEVEYLPCSYLEEAEGVIRDFIEQVELPNGPNVRYYFSRAPVSEEDKTEGPREFSILDTGMQYMELLRLR